MRKRGKKVDIWKVRRGKMERKGKERGVRSNKKTESSMVVVGRVGEGNHTDIRETDEMEKESGINRNKTFSPHYCCSH